ncbi:MAG: glycosyltransferase family 2 protein [Oleiphilaceae bacterium]|nr:glycosyltransferase family 2 protein [Oleiphilaceae bacterium]
MSEVQIPKVVNLSVVIPCYNEEEVLPETIKRLGQLIDSMIEEQLISEESSIWFVDDGSRDKTWSLIEEASQNTLFRGIKLSRNKGHQYALLAGLENADGDVLVSIDADLQDDISVIRAMVEEYYKGNDIVYGVRSERGSDTFFKRFTAESYYRVLKRFGVDVVFNHADFRLMSRRAVEALSDYREVNLFLRGVVREIGFPSTQVEYARSERFAGESKYPLKKMLALAVDGITSFSPVPLRMIAVLGFLVFLFSSFIAAWALWTRLFTDQAVPGWASSVLPMYILGGIQLLSLGVIGEYIAKIFMEVKARPRYLIDKCVGL